jgi:hypothetical protein
MFDYILYYLLYTDCHSPPIIIKYRNPRTLNDSQQLSSQLPIYCLYSFLQSTLVFRYSPHISSLTAWQGQDFALALFT